MPEHPGFELRPVNGRSMVQLRVRPNGVGTACESLQLPQPALQWRSGDPAMYWLAPDQWLITSDNKPSEEILSHIHQKLSLQLYAATDMSSSYVCFALEGPAARLILAMGCGIDMHPAAFKTGQCKRTNFASVLLFIVAVEDHHFDLYIDRSHANYLSEWLLNSAEDPMTHDS
jgi:sarcosine oxidase subunit gamma